METFSALGVNMPGSVLLAAILAIASTIACITYQLYLHPLAGYPGPLLAKLTDLYPAYHAWKGDLAHELERLHGQHGDKIRFGPNRMSFNTVSALNAIYGFKTNTRKSRYYYTFANTPGKPSTHTAIDKIEHGRKRRLVAQGLNSKSMKDLEPKIIECVDVLISQLRSTVSSASDSSTTSSQTHSTTSDSKDWSTPKDLGSWSSYFTNDVMGALVFSNSFALMTTSSLHWISPAIISSARSKSAGSYYPLLILSGLEAFLWPGLYAARARLKSFSVAQLQTRVARAHDQGLHDLFGFILAAKDPETGESFGVEELASESGLLIAAGGDTTSTAIAGVFHFLTQARHRGVLDRLTAEIRGAFERVEDIRPGPVLSSLVYLRAVMDEAMRLAPPVPSPLPREVQKGGVEIDGDLFAEGTDLAVAAYAIMRNPEYYRDPLEFRPERWIEGETDEAELKTAKAAFCPFSIGARGCVGKSLAYVELSLVIARVLWELDVRRVEGSKVGEDERGLYVLGDVFVCEKEGPMVQFRPRAD